MEQRKIVSISRIGNGADFNSISIIFNDGESAVFTNFAKAIYTQTSPGVLKKTLVEFKKDIIKFNWDINKLQDLWV